MATSTILAFTAALIAQLQARPLLFAVQITDGWPKAPQGDLILLDDVDGEQRFAALNAVTRPKDETYEQTVYVRSVHPGADNTTQTAANARAFALLAELEAQLRADPTVNGTVRVAELGRGQLKLDKGFSLDGSERVALITTTVHVTARI